MGNALTKKKDTRASLSSGASVEYLVTDVFFSTSSFWFSIRLHVLLPFSFSMHTPQRELQDKSGQDLNRVSTVQAADARKSEQHWAVLKTNRHGADNPDGD